MELATTATVMGNGAIETGAEADGTAATVLRGEGERLKLERDVEQLRVELAKLRAPQPPWWRRGSIVATMTAIIAAVVPVTTAVQQHYQKERELALQESKQANDIRTGYLDRLEKPGAKLRTLRFVMATTTDPDLKAWAQAETKEVKADLHDIDKQIEAVDKEIETLSQAVRSSTAMPDTADVHNEDGMTRMARKRELLIRKRELPR